jgi:hypothetical protein
MSVLEALRIGRVTPDAYELVGDTFRAIIRLRGIPAPEGAGRWTSEAVEDAVHDFLADRAGTGRLARMALRARNDREFRRLLDAAVKNFLVDQVRKGTRVKLWRRLREVLSGDVRFVEVGDAWTLQGLPAIGRWGGREADLVAAAWQVRAARVVRWRPHTRREGPVADRAALAGVCAAIIETAEVAPSLKWTVATLEKANRARTADRGTERGQFNDPPPF